MSEVKKGTVLYGMMGSGKTTLGKGLAHWLHQPFVDTDELIEQRYEVSCAELVANGKFPEQQRAVILGYTATEPEVIATGGSVAKFPELVEHLGQYGVGIFIDVEPAVLEARLSPERIAALHNPDNVSFTDLYEERREAYESAADLVLHVPGEQDPKETLGFLVSLRNSIDKKW